jgi:arylsulfatase A-like enzyme
MSDRPNLLIVMTDHQRADTVLPEHPAITPNVSRMFEDGVAFTQTYCPTPHCCPARATFMSGLYPSRHGIWNNILNEQALSRTLNEGVRLWSQDYAGAGYTMHFMGKWHVDAQDWPRDRGWTEHMATATGHARHGPKWDHYEEMAKEPEPETRGEGEILRPGWGTYRLYGTRPEGRKSGDDRVAEKAIEVLSGLSEGDAPWCVYVGFGGPHDPYGVPQRFLDMYNLDDVPLPESYADEMADKPAIYRRMRGQNFGQLTEREVREGVRHFWAYCTYLDDLFGGILNALRKTGQEQRTLVLYCSDHADYVGEHGLWCKGIPSFRGAYHVPAVVRWPAGIRNGGRRVEQFVSHADFALTFLELAGVETDRYFTGASLVPFLRDETPAGWRDEIHTQCNGLELYYTQRSVMTKEFKYVFNGFDVDELYDLRRDPHEMRNLIDDTGYEDVVRQMCGRIWRFARREEDGAINNYITVSLAPHGPAEAFRERR